MRVYLAEMVGTAMLTLAIIASINSPEGMTPVVASVTLGLLVYLLGPISGCHINPAVTFGMKWINQINIKQFFGYVVSQILGAGIAYFVAVNLLGVNVNVPASGSMSTGVGEIIGTMMLVFGVSMVVVSKTNNNLSGIIIGASLFVGIMIASAVSGAVLNPAVAAGLGINSLTYYISPLIGAIAGVELAKLLNRK